MAAVLEVQLRYAMGLKNTELLSKQDPYVKLQLGGQATRSRTHVDGGTRPVWNEVFRFNISPADQELVLTVMNENHITSDELVGMARVQLAQVRQSGSQSVQAPVYCGKTGRQYGAVDLVLLCHAGYQQAAPYAPMMPPQQGMFAPPAAPYGAAPGYAPAAGYAYQQASYSAAPPAQYGAPYSSPQPMPFQQPGYNAYAPPAYGYAPGHTPHY